MRLVLTERLAGYWSRVRVQVWRGVYLAAVVSFLFPFVTVKGCDSSEFRDYRGFELLTVDHELVFLVPMCLGAVLFALSFLRRKVRCILAGFLKTSKLVLSLAAVGTSSVWTDLVFLFGEVHWRVGRVLNVICWGLVALSSYVASLGLYRAASTVGRGAPGETAASRAWLSSQICWRGLGIMFLVVPPVTGLVLSEGIASRLRDAGLFCLTVGVPFFLLFYFVSEGLRRLERWAAVCTIVSSPLLCALGVIGWLRWVAPGDWVWLLLTSAATSLMGGCFVGSLLAWTRRNVWSKRSDSELANEI